MVNKSLVLEKQHIQRLKNPKHTKKLNYWAKIPVRDVYSGVWVPIKPHEKTKTTYSIKDPKIVRKDYGFELYLSITKKADTVEAYNSAIGIRLESEKTLHTCIRLSQPSNPTPQHSHRQHTRQTLLP
ncbi:MAG: hypothetical protein BTN85_1620 [Candidatus Methanohalarchaeum thermophilum]|uniref:Uncharacterized protein n=1 Tax=Methanohalarchaeum thermophilum TaxID=1903181 RepID=A0A1Q6DXL8_METT1|nr:MAG: hypothetical protein BTN85_1620 [Candidatus Methanohalarchaeum thermophilum]